jgi:hypothetical protein
VRKTPKQHLAMLCDPRPNRNLQRPAHNVVGREHGRPRLGRIAWQRIPWDGYRAAARWAGFRPRLQAGPAFGDGKTAAAFTASAAQLRAWQGALSAALRPSHLFQGG